MSTNAPQKAADEPHITSSLWRWAGIAGPIVFFATMTVDGAVTPGYSAWAEPISYLELGPAGWVQVVNFIVLGVLLVAFGWAFFGLLRGRIGRVTAGVTALLLVLSGLGYVMAGVFVTAPPGQPQYPMHTVAFSTVVLPLGVATILAGVQFARDRDWRILGAYSILVGLVLLAAGLGNLSSLFASTPQTPLSSPESRQVLGGNGGLLNRVVIGLALAWYVIVASLLLRETTSESC